MMKKPQTLINVSINSGSLDDLLSSEAVRESVKSVERELGREGRVLLLKSGTEPLVRVMVEANNQVTSKRCAEFIANVLRS